MANLFKTGAVILGLLLLVLSGLWLAGGRTRWFSGSTQQAGLQASATPTPASQPAIPASEATVVNETETATFALG